jgi:cellulose biosynthesis protein BcsQ
MSLCGKKRSDESMIYKEEGKIIFFCGSKGGCGTTFISISVSNYFASSTNKNILFIDMNPNRDDARYIFKISNDFEKNISDLESIMNDLDFNVIKKIISNLENSLNVILSGRKVLSLDNLLKLLSFIKDYFDLIFVDFPLGLYDISEFYKISFIDKFILVTSPELISLINLSKNIQRLKDIDYINKVSLIANKYNRLRDVSFINRLVKFPIDLFLQYDRDIENLFLSGKPQMIFKYNLKIIKNLKNYCMKLCSELSGDHIG